MKDERCGSSNAAMRCLIAFCIVPILLAGCATTPHNPLAVWVASPNFGVRRASMIVLHYTQEANAKDALHTLRTRNPGGPVSAHYLVGRNGMIYQLVADKNRAWHAGASWWGTSDDVNSRSIGIEIDNNGAEPYPQTQIDSLLRLLTNLTTKLEIPPSAIVGHADVAPTHRADPGVLFPWAELAKHGFGLWYDAGPLPDPPAGFDPMVALRLIGYDITDPVAAVIAWHRHFRADSATTFDAPDLRILWNLEGKVMCEGLSRSDPDKMPPAPPFASAQEYRGDVGRLGLPAINKVGHENVWPGGNYAVTHKTVPKPESEAAVPERCH